MSHVYVVTSSSYIPSVAGIPPDPAVTVIGSVDGIAVTVTFWLSAVTAAFNEGGQSAVNNLIAPVMLAQSILNSPPPPVIPTQLPTGTFTQ
jgi:hypothetical protein